MSITVEGAPVEELGPDLAALEIDPDLLHVTRAMVEHRTGELVYTRRWLHARPEVSRAEHETTAVLRERLQAEGLAPRAAQCRDRPDLRHRRTRARWWRCRADIDALAMSDTKDVPYRSMNEGACHACGHDVHTAVVLGAGLVLRELIESGRVRGRLRLIFEPSEEAMPGGALDVIADGGMEGVQGIFGLHCDPKIDAGQLGCRIGPITSASHNVTIRMTGPGGHTARPSLTVNLADEVARVVHTLPGAVQAAADGIAADPARGEVRLVFGSIHTGSASNVIPSAADLSGSLRTPDTVVSEALLSIVPLAISQILGTDLRPSGEGHEGARARRAALVPAPPPGCDPRDQRLRPRPA